MVEIAIVPRSEWGFNGWASQPYSVSLSERTEFFTHYNGNATAPLGLKGSDIPRAVHSWHKGQGWSGIGYNFIIDNATGVIYEGRGFNLVGAHCPGHNRQGLSSQIFIGEGESPSQVALNSQRALYDYCSERVGRTLAMRGHRDGITTSCPGDPLYAWVRAGMPSNGAVVPKPEIPSGSAPAYPLGYNQYFGPRIPVSNVNSVSGYYSHREDLKRWQARMAERGWSIDVDGLYGPNTASVARAFQIEKGLFADGLIGPATWRAAWEAPIT